MLFSLEPVVKDFRTTSKKITRLSFAKAGQVTTAPTDDLLRTKMAQTPELQVWLNSCFHGVKFGR